MSTSRSRSKSDRVRRAGGRHRAAGRPYVLGHLRSRDRGSGGTGRRPARQTRSVAGHYAVAQCTEPPHGRNEQQPAYQSPVAAGGDQRPGNRKMIGEPFVTVDPPGGPGYVGRSETQTLQSGFVEPLRWHSRRPSRPSPSGLDPPCPCGAEAAVAVVYEKAFGVVGHALTLGVIGRAPLGHRHGRSSHV